MHTTHLCKCTFTNKRKLEKMAFNSIDRNKIFKNTFQIHFLSFFKLSFHFFFRSFHFCVAAVMKINFPLVWKMRKLLELLRHPSTSQPLCKDTYVLFIRTYILFFLYKIIVVYFYLMIIFCNYLIFIFSFTLFLFVSL